MSTNPADTDATPETPAVAPPAPGSMHRPGHSPLDTIEIAATDDVLHDAALRDSCLRVPR